GAGRLHVEGNRCRLRLRNPADTTTWPPPFLSDRPSLPLYMDWIFTGSDIASQHCNWRCHRSVDLSLRRIGFQSALRIWRSLVLRDRSHAIDPDATGRD